MTCLLSAVFSFTPIQLDDTRLAVSIGHQLFGTQLYHRISVLSTNPARLLAKDFLSK